MRYSRTALTVEAFRSPNCSARYRADVYRFSPYRQEAPEDVNSLSYGDLHPVTDEVLDTDFYVPGLLSGSDYSGDSVTVSNHRVFLEQFSELKEKGIWEVYGGHGTYAVAIRLNAITEEMLEVFASLEDYPVIDESDMSEVEMEAENEAWENWAESDFKAELIKAFPEQEERIESLTDDSFPTLASIFYKAMERANEYWTHETGNSAYVDVERVCAKVVETDITVPYGDTSLVGRLPFSN